MEISGRERSFEGFTIGECHHEHSPGSRVLSDDDDEPLPFVEVDAVEVELHVASLIAPRKS